jgi:hypothetical protein
VPSATREKDRYARASWRERLGDEFATLRRSPRLLLLLALLFGGWLVLEFTAPRVVQLADLTGGECIHVPTASNTDVTAARPIGTAVEVSDVLATQGATVAPCDGSHSHEVAAVFADADAPGTPYPGQSELEMRHRAACEAAFIAYVGHAVAGSAFASTVVVPRESGWVGGRRSGACLVSDAAGQYLMARVKGTGR